MDDAQKALFGRFPRAIATNQPSGQLRQWVVHSEGEFDVFFNAVNGTRNAYASISRRPVGGALKLDKVSIDFDTPQKDGDDDGWPVFGGAKPPEDEIVARMREDEYIADEVLAPVVQDARDLIERAQDEGVPSLAVFSGMGMHVHLFYEEQVNPDKQIDTTAKKFIRDLNLTTADMSPIGDVKRIMRIPNAQRVHLETEGGQIVTSRPAGVYTIPLLPDELLNVTPRDLLAMAREPRVPDMSHLHPANRPEMKTFENYIDSGEPVEIEQADMRKVEEPVSNDEFLDVLFRDLLQMPCMYERIQQPEPDHTIRRNCAVLLYNLGMEPDDVMELFGQIGWSDWDREITAKQLRNIYQNGYADMGCYRLRSEGFCTRADDPHSCHAFGWSGGKAEWK